MQWWERKWLCLWPVYTVNFVSPSGHSYIHCLNGTSSNLSKNIWKHLLYQMPYHSLWPSWFWTYWSWIIISLCLDMALWFAGVLVPPTKMLCVRLIKNGNIMIQFTLSKWHHHHEHTSHESLPVFGQDYMDCLCACGTHILCVDNHDQYPNQMSWHWM